MKRNKKNIILVLLLLAVVLCFTACSDNWEAPYASLTDGGYGVSVRFDANGGQFAGANDVYIVDVFSMENAVAVDADTVGFHLLTPDDPARGLSSFTITRNDYFLAGWYTEKTLRTDASGNALDDYGVLCSESGRPQGYTYGGKWDFAEDLLTVSKNGDHRADTPEMTLYAAWIPYINYQFYAVDADSGTVTAIETVQTIDLEVPQWNEKSSKLEMKQFPTQEGMTFDSAYLNADLSEPLTETIHAAESYVDYETGTLNVEFVAIYTTWLEGTWYKIYTAEQFCSNSRLDGNYIICADLDFAEAVWSPTLIKGSFTGTIQGNGYTFRNITATQADNSQIYGGLFGTLSSGAQIHDLNLENVSFTISAGSRMQGACFGLLAGSIASDAVLDNVTAGGTLYISEKCYPQSDYTIGLLCGSDIPNGVNYTIGCRIAEDNSEKITVTVEDDGTVTVTFAN